MIRDNPFREKNKCTNNHTRRMQAEQRQRSQLCIDRDNAYH